MSGSLDIPIISLRISKKPVRAVALSPVKALLEEKGKTMPKGEIMGKQLIRDSNSHPSVT